MTRTQVYWLCQIAGWTLVGGIIQAIHPENWAPNEIQTTLFWWGLGTSVGIGLTHAFRTFAKQHGWTRLPIKQLIPRGIAASVFLGVLFEGSRDMLVVSDLLRAAAFDRAAPASTLGAIRDVFGASMVMGAWVGVYFSAHAVWNYRRAEIHRWKLQARAEAARLEALKLQLNPRFFFNSLSSVRSLISEAPGRAKKMVARLARLLRQALQSRDETTVLLQEELSTTETYLRIQKVRFESRLEWEIDASETALGREVPFMLVQSLVENAVRYGVRRRQDGGRIFIEAAVPDGSGAEDKGALRLQVTGPGELDGSSARGSSTGLENARERLELLFGDEASLELHPNDLETVAATALIPQQVSAEQSEASRREPPRYAPGVMARTAGEQPKLFPAGAPEGPTYPGSSDALPQPHPLKNRSSSSSPGSPSSRQDSSSVHPWSGSLTYWLCQIGGWGSFLVLAMLANDDIWSRSWNKVMWTFATVVGVNSGIGIGVTHAFRMYVKTHGWTTLSLRQLALRAGAAIPLLGITHVLVLSPLSLASKDLPSAWGPWLQVVFGEMVSTVFTFSMLMGIWITVYFGVHAARSYRQAEIDQWRLQARAKAARLDALKLQLNPHFFFNCLSSVRSLISEAPRQAKKMTARLARLLRRTLQAGDEKTVPLREELSTTETYLQLEEVRFEDRLGWNIDASEAALSRAVPFMLVQTLAENAVKHGIGQRRGGGTIQVKADATADDTLRLQVTNPGELDDGSVRGTSTGLRNARERLHLLFGDDASLELNQSGPETVTATARIPQPAALEDRVAGDEAPSHKPDRALAEEILTGASGP